MSFFSNEKNVPVGTIPGLVKGKQHLPSSFDPAPPSYYIPKIEKNKILDASESSNGSGPADYSNYYTSEGVKAGKIYIRSVKTKYTVAFPAMLDSFTDTFSPSFKTENQYGRTDAVQNFSNTTRTISLSFRVVAYDEEHARKNLHTISALVQFLYPIYEEETTCKAMIIRETPMLRVRLANMIQRTGRPGGIYEKDGLLTVPTDLSFAPNLEAGVFFSEDGSYIYPKEFKVTMSFSVLHEESLGWIKTTDSIIHWMGKLNSSGNVGSNSVDFPWGNDPIKATATPPVSATAAAATTTGEAAAGTAATTILIA